MSNVISLDRARQQRQFHQRAAGLTEKLLQMNMNPVEAHRYILQANMSLLTQVPLFYNNHRLYKRHQPNQQYLDEGDDNGMLFTHVETLESRILPGHYVQHRLVYLVSPHKEDWFTLRFQRLELWKYQNGDFVFDRVADPEKA